MYYRWICSVCDCETEISRPVRDYLDPPKEEEFGCSCEGGRKRFSKKTEAAVICNRHHPQYGRSRLSKDGALRDMAEISQLEQDAYDLHEEERAPIMEEIQKIHEGDTNK